MTIVLLKTRVQFPAVLKAFVGAGAGEAIVGGTAYSPKRPGSKTTGRWKLRRPEIWFFSLIA